MKTTITSIAAILLIGSIAQFAIAEPVPAWVKNNAGWWADGTISESEFIQGIEFLIQDGIIVVPPTQVSEQKSQGVPEWVKNNAAWWANGDIDDESFVQGIQFLIKSGLISIGANDKSVEEPRSSDGKELGNLEAKLEECNSIKKAYERLECERAVKHEMKVLEFGYVSKDISQY